MESYPPTASIYLRRITCRIARFGVNQLNLLDGPYNILDQIVVNSPDQFFDVVITEQEELFAMDFRYEPNGNIDYVEWKVTDNQVKYYDYSYDPLNRITDAGYGVKRKVGTTPPRFLRHSHRPDRRLPGLRFRV